MDLVIDRNIWLRGEEQSTSYLLRPVDQKQCCVGIYLEACGVPRDNLLGIKAAAEVEGLPTEAHWLKDRQQYEDAMALYSVNDANRSGSPDDDEVTFIDEAGFPEEVADFDNVDFIAIAEELREKFIADLFARHDVNVTFIN